MIKEDGVPLDTPRERPLEPQRAEPNALFGSKAYLVLAWGSHGLTPTILFIKHEINEINGKDLKVGQVMSLRWRLITCPIEAAQKGFFSHCNVGGLGGGGVFCSPRVVSGPQGEWSTYFCPVRGNCVWLRQGPHATGCSA